MPLAEFKQMGLDDLRRNQRAYDAIVSGVKMTKPTADELLSASTKLVAEAHDYVVAHHIAKLPTARLSHLLRKREGRQQFQLFR